MKKVLVLNPYLPTMGGGEKHMGYLCKFIEDYYEGSVTIDILVHNYNNINIHDENYVTIDNLNKQFALQLNRTYIRKIDINMPSNLKESLYNKKLIEDMTKEYDLFINFMFLSKHIGKAKINMYGCMFPAKPYVKEIKGNFLKKMGAKYYDYRFFNSYDSFICNSAYTNHWLNEYWKNSKKNRVIYPPVFSKEEIYGRYNESEKENIIVSVGRFFVGAHSKKQLDMVKMFVNNKEKFDNYEYHLVGAVSNYEEDIEYLNKIKEIASTTNNVYIHENYPFKELMDLYRKSKIFWHGTGYLVDEALSVGDTRFQKKCYRKMEEFKKEKTIILVTHDIGVISKFCDRVAWIEKGHLKEVGEPIEISKRYTAYIMQSQLTKEDIENKSTEVNENKDKGIINITGMVESYGDKKALITGIGMFQNESLVQTIMPNEDTKIKIRVEYNENIFQPIVGFTIKDRLGNVVFQSNSEALQQEIDGYNKKCQEYEFVFIFPELNVGQYTISPAIASGTQANHVQHNWIHDAYVFNVINNNLYNLEGTLSLSNIRFNQI